MQLYRKSSIKPFPPPPPPTGGGGGGFLKQKSEMGAA